ncbi:MarR family transcriptional regulator [Streptacidiphilus sp. ASG 303]|uniref:MarR family winged helix-turn-helix transcriptional regulator n=1 Tax=Streptacidiphilus sp. ASG 303 TaxID=2896847 RepID=UPI001E41864F|nr:MarR family transcriptional regulator [Streptacidiphilus sp. ASG 303]MCD0484464.1 MarR family transcriptional regulator [Streptacidiphilus sp. ASG 303]
MAETAAAPTAETPTTADLMEAVAAVGAAYFHDFAAAAARLGLTSAQAKALGAVQEPVPMRALAGRLGCDASNVTGIVDRLEGRGLAVRRAAETDRRVKIVVVTDEGREALHSIRAGMERARRAFDSLDDGQRRALHGLCGALLPLLAGPGQD